MNIIDKIKTISIADRISIAEGIKRQFPVNTEADGTITLDYSKQFDQFKDILRYIEFPLMDFFKLYNIPLTSMDISGKVVSSNVNDAILYLLNNSTI